MKHCKGTATRPLALGDVCTDPSLSRVRCFQVAGLRELLPRVLSQAAAQASLLGPDEVGVTWVCTLQGSLVYFIHHMLSVVQEGSCCIAWAASVGLALLSTDSVNAPHLG